MISITGHFSLTWTAMPDALLQQGFALLISAVFLFVVIGLGRLVLSNINTPFTSFGEMIFYSSGIGFGVAGYCVFFLGLFDGFHPLPIRILLIFLLAVSLAGWIWVPKPFMKGVLQKLYSPWDAVAFILLLLCLATGLLLTLTPEIGRDALIYHLAVPKLFLKNQGFAFIPGNIFSNYPLHSEMLFLAGLYLQGDILAKGLHFIMLLMILLGMNQFIRYRMTEHDFPVLSLLIFASIPSVFLITHMAYNDLFVTFYSMVAVFAFINWHDRAEKGWLVLSGIFTGLAMASKYTSLLLPFLGCLGVLWTARNHRLPLGGALRHLILYISILAIVGSPFYVKNWIVTGNPFYPFLYSIFGGRGWNPQQAQFYDFFVRSLGMGRTIVDYILLPWNLSFLAKMDSPQFDGIIGPIFITTLPFAMGIHKAAIDLKIMGFYCLLTFLFWASSAQQIRYLIPVFPFLAIITGSILTNFKKNKLMFYLLVFLISGGLAFNGYHIFRDFLKIAPVRVVTGKEDRQAFLRRMLPSYGMFEHMNRHLAPDAKIFLIYMKNWTFLCDRECYSDSMFESYTIEQMLSRASTPAEVFSMLAENKFTHVLFDINYIYGTLSTFTPAAQTLFQAFTKEHLQLVRADGSYFLYCIKQ